MRFGVWQRRKSRALARERFLLLHQFLITGNSVGWRNLRLRHHIERELSFYEMWFMRPGLEILEKRTRGAKKLARKVTRFVERFEQQKRKV